MKGEYTLQAKLWLYPGENAAWHFLTVPKKESENIKKTFGKNARGFGSLPIIVHIGSTTWKTSIFPDSKSGTYILPVKAMVRKNEGLFEGDTVRFSIEVKI